MSGVEICKNIPTFGELREIFGSTERGIEIISTLLRNSRLVTLYPFNHNEEKKLVDNIIKWSSMCVTDLMAMNYEPDRGHIYLYFEQKADLAQFILAFEGYNALVD